MTVEAITAILGGPKLLKPAPKTTTDLITLTRKGLPARALSELAGDLKIERKAIGRVLGIPERTWMRRTSSGARLTAAESDRTLRFARVIAFAIDVLGTAELASQWLQTDNIALLDSKPIDLLDTDTGIKSVEEVLGRIAYGLYS